MSLWPVSFGRAESLYSCASAKCSRLPTGHFVPGGDHGERQE